MVLYSSGCPKCNILKKKLEQKKFDFELIEDENKMIDMGFSSAPMLEDDGNFYNFEEAINYIKDKENKTNE